MPEQAANIRNKNFEEVTLGYTAAMAIDEAERCLNCKSPRCVAGCPVNVDIPQFIHAHLHKLEVAGFLSRDPSKPRALELTQEASWRQKTLVPVPLVGNVHAGQPILAVENIEETYPIPFDLLGCKEDVFM